MYIQHYTYMYNVFECVDCRMCKQQYLLNIWENSLMFESLMRL